MLLLVHLSSALLAWLCAERWRNWEQQGKAAVRERSREQQRLGRVGEEQNLVAAEYGRSRERAQN
jgi:hypothetical protein